MLSAWLAALRLKTLPLSLGAIIIGSWLNTNSFRFEIFGLAALTAVLLQILSNLANDYGDFVKGTDRDRVDRQVASGKISPMAMKWAVYTFAFLAFISGCALLYISFGTQWTYLLAYLGIGVLSILAAILYTMGKRAYGYYGLGDLFVFLFFGLVGINGTALLYEQSFDLIQILPGVSYGLICVAVLNVNNIRDIEKDLLNNKITVASKLGKEGARSYQALLLLTSCISLLAHHFLASYTSLAPVGLVILSYIHIRNLSASLLPSEYNRQLRMLSIWSLGIAILFVFQLHL